MKLSTKLVLAFVPIVACGTALNVAFSRGAVEGLMLDSIVRRAEASVTGDADALARAAGAERTLLPLLQSLAAKTGSGSAAVSTLSGKYVAHTDIVSMGRPDPDAGVAPGGPARVEVRASATGRVLVLRLPLWDANADPIVAAERDGKALIGIVRLEIPLAETDRTTALMAKRMTAIGAGTLTLILLLLLPLVRGLIAPIRVLAASAERIGEGALGMTVAVSGDDEVSDLARSFNRMSAALAETTVSRDFLDRLLSGIQEALFVFDGSGRLILASRSALALVGRPGETGLEAGQVMKSPAWLRGPSVENIETELLDKSGAPILALVSSGPFEIGGETGRILVARDIRERKALERRMALSDKMSAVGQLASGVAHEINNPLGVILGFAQALVRRKAVDASIEMPLKSIEREALRCRDLVQSLLTFSRQETRGDALVDARAAVTNALALVEAQTRVRKVELVREVAPGALTLRGSTTQVQQIVINLCTNALDAMPQGGLLRVEARPHKDHTGSWIRISVKDTGEGIPESVRARMWEPFFTTKEIGKGTGLGLPLVHELVERHHGRLDFESEVGKGTTFHVDLPAAV